MGSQGSEFIEPVPSERNQTGEAPLLLAAGEIEKYNFVTKSKAMVQSYFSKRSYMNSTLIGEGDGRRNFNERRADKYLNAKARTPPIYPDKERCNKIKDSQIQIINMKSKLFTPILEVTNGYSFDNRTTKIIPEDLTESTVMVRKYAKNFRMSERSKLSYDLMPSSLKQPKLLYNKAKSDQTIVLFGSHKNHKASNKFNTTYWKSQEGILTIEITDTGCGMSEKEVQRIYQPFVQANEEVQQKFGGTGLGLWLCHKLIKAMKGTINCESQINKGTSFTVELKVKHKELDKDIESTSIFSHLTIICLYKNEEEIKSALRDTSCKIISRRDIKEIIETLKGFKLEKMNKYVILVGLKVAREIYNICKIELLGLKFSQIIIITSNGCSNRIEKLVVNDENFQYVLTYPINKYYLLNILSHSIKGQELYKDTNTYPKNIFNVLIVDDNDLCMSAVARLMKQYTKKLSTCINGMQALDKIKSTQFDIAIIDYQMPGMDGTELIKEIRKHEKQNALTPMTILCTFFLLT